MPVYRDLHAVLTELSMSFLVFLLSASGRLPATALRYVTPRGYEMQKPHSTVCRPASHVLDRFGISTDRLKRRSVLFPLAYLVLIVCVHQAGLLLVVRLATELMQFYE